MASDDRCRSPVRVQFVNTTYGPGGASQIVSNLDSEFRRLGVDTDILVARAEGPRGSHVRELPKVHGLIERCTNRLANEVGLNNNGIVSTFGLRRDDSLRKTDIVNLHNLHGGYFNFLALPSLTRIVPAVLTLHDMWAFTGHCVYSLDCAKWKRGCGKCPYPYDYPRLRRDSTLLEHRLKRWAFARSRLHVVAISTWIRDLAKESLLGSLPIHYIPNGIDLEAFRPADKIAARRLFGLSADRHVVLYVAHHPDDRRKGFDLLTSAMSKLPPSVSGSCTVLLMGDVTPERTKELPNAINLGFVADPQRKAQAFAAADVVAVPTRADNLPIVLQESLACGRPAVSFNVGGVPDLVKHEVTGMLARPEATDQFADCLRAVLEDGEWRDRMGRAARALAESEFSLPTQARRYLALFQEILHEPN